MAAVQDIVELLAIEPPISVDTPLMSSFNHVSTCASRNNEELSAFTSRFRVLAVDHILHDGVAVNSQVVEALAITLINNSNLIAETLYNAKMQLFGVDKARQSTASRSPSSLTPN